MIDKIEKDFDIKITWYQKLHMRIIYKLYCLDTAIHRPYMIKAILTTRCPHCGRWFSFPKIEPQRTLYQDKYDNYFCGCKECQEENVTMWDSMWEDYYSSIL